MTQLESIKKMLEGAIEEMGKTTQKELLPKLSAGEASLVIRDEGETWFYFDKEGNLVSVRVYND